MLKAGDLARREDRWVRGLKSGKPDEIGGYHMYGCPLFPDLCMLFHSQVLPCESNLCTQIRCTMKHSAIKKDTYFGKKGRLMVLFNAST